MKRLFLSSAIVIASFTSAAAETFYATITNVQPRYHIVTNSVPTKQCYETQVPVYGSVQGEGASGGDVLGGAIIGGILGKALTDNDKGAAFGAIVGAMGAAENKKTSKQIVGYQKQTKCDTVYVQEQSQQLKDYKISFQWQGVYGSAYTFNHYNVGDRIPVEVRLRAK